MKEEKSVGYSRLIGGVFLFNLIVGTGALTMPKAFQQSGWLLSSILLIVLCFFSFVTATFVIEAMSISNGLKRLMKMKYTMTNESFMGSEINEEAIKTMKEYSRVGSEISVNRNYGSIPESGSSESILDGRFNDSYFEITEVFEMGEMAISYFNRLGLVLFYLSMCIYLYGDLAVYAAAVPVSIRDVVCTYMPTENDSNKTNLTDRDPCWSGTNVSRINAYRIFLSVFVLLLCPFIFFNVSKTKLLQVTTLVMRWFAFAIMFVLFSVYLASGHYGNRPQPVNITKAPSFLGICIYSFMCHHSLPSLITPIKNKRHIYLLMLVTFVVILVFYFTLSFLASFSLNSIESLITLSFKPSDNTLTDIQFFQYYLSLFPVFSISASFPIIGITLRNNLKNLITCGTGRKFKYWIMDKFLYPLLAIIPPIIIVFITNDVTFLVGFTGSYAGSFIQYIIPTALVLCARRHLSTFFSKFQHTEIIMYEESEFRIIYQSPFKHIVWSIIIFLWSAVSLIFVTVNYSIN